VEFVDLLLWIIQLLMLIRAVMSWMPIDEDSTFYNFLVSATEPIIYPVRAIVEKIPAVSGMPIDISFFLTVVILSVVQMLLPTVYL